MASNNDSTQGEEVIGQLIASAGPGKTASPEAKARIYSSVHAHWEAETRQQRSKPRRESAEDPDSAGSISYLRSSVRAAAARPAGRWRNHRMIGIAATVAMAAVVLYWLQSTGSEDASFSEIARFAHIEGEAVLLRNDESRRLASDETGGAVLGRDVMRTGTDGRVALRLHDGLLLRLNVSTEVEFLESDEIELVAGTVYIDAGQEPSSPPLEVVTPFGVVEHLGTQYEVHFEDAALRIRVREGRIAFSGESTETTGVAGEQLEIDASGRTSRSTIAADDSAWNWAVALATLPPADEYRADEILTWIARERGLTLDYASPTTRRESLAMPTIGLEGFNPIEIVDVFERITGLRLEVRDMELRVSN